MGVDPNDPSGGGGAEFSNMNVDPSEIFKMFFGSEGGFGGFGDMGKMGKMGSNGSCVFTTGFPG